MNTNNVTFQIKGWVCLTEQRHRDEQSLWVRWTKNRDPEAGDLLIKKFKPLVSYHVQRIAVGLPKNISRDDLDESWDDGAV